MTQAVEIKAHYRDLVTACGGPKRAAGLVGAQASHLSEAMATHNLDRWPRLDHVAILEADCGQPVVTRFLADRLGFDLDPQAARPGGDLPHIFASALKEMTDVQVAYVTAIANRQIDAGERRDLVKQANQAIARLQDFIVTIRGGAR